MAEDHDLTDGEAAIEVAEVLPDVAQGELLLTQLDHDGVGDDPLRKGPHGFLVGKAGNQDSSSQQSSPVDADALTGEALRVDHDVGLVQHEQGDLRQVQDVLLEAPVQCGAWCPDDDLLLQHCSLQNCKGAEGIWLPSGTELSVFSLGLLRPWLLSGAFKGSS
uniref:Uncharacterized protein n=1 Tax=Cyanoderma ruficeps TaxID=181631 RepID=A0A8C3QJ00_9PASS